MPACSSDADNCSRPNCGLWRDCGIVRTSTSRVTPCAISRLMNSSIGRVEWPSVKTVTRSSLAPLGRAGTVHVTRRQFEQANRWERWQNPLQIAVHPCYVERHRIDLTRPARPLALGSTSLLVQIVAHRVERFDDGFNTLAEFDAREIPVQQLELLLLVHRGAPCLRELEEVGSQHAREARRAREISHQDAINEGEARAAFRQYRGHEYGDIGMQRALILFQFREPAIVPIAGVLALPHDGAALAAARVDSDLMQVRPA